jgi:hypothetical protein
MGGFTEGFDQFYKKIDEIKILAPLAIDISIEETAEKCIEDIQKVIYEKNAIDTGALYDSWKIREDNKQTGGYVDSTHSLEVWSDPTIVVDEHPKHPGGEYYPPLIENGFIKPNGKRYKGIHMLKLAFSNCKRNLKANLKKNIGDVFSK